MESQLASSVAVVIAVHSRYVHHDAVICLLYFDRSEPVVDMSVEHDCLRIVPQDFFDLMILHAGRPCIAVCIGVVERLVQNHEDRLVRRRVFRQLFLKPIQLFRGEIRTVLCIPLGIQHDKMISVDPFVIIGLAVRNIAHVFLVIFQVPAFRFFPSAGEPSHIVVAHCCQDLEIILVRSNDIEIALRLADRCVVAVIAAVEQCGYAGIVVGDIIHGVDQLLVR